MEPKWLKEARACGLFVQTWHEDKGIVVITHAGGWCKLNDVYQVISYSGEQILDIMFTPNYQEVLDYYLV